MKEGPVGPSNRFKRNSGFHQQDKQTGTLNCKYRYMKQELEQEYNTVR